MNSEMAYLIPNSVTQINENKSLYYDDSIDYRNILHI